MSAIGQVEYEAQNELRLVTAKLRDEQATLKVYAEQPIDEFSEMSAALMEDNAKVFSKNLGRLAAAQKVLTAIEIVKGDEEIPKGKRDAEIIKRIARLASRSSNTHAAHQGTVYSQAYIVALHELLNAALSA